MTENALLTADIWTPFTAFVKKKNADFIFDLEKNEIAYLQKQIRASIGRNLFGNEVFYQLLLENDKFVEKARAEF